MGVVLVVVEPHPPRPRSIHPEHPPLVVALVTEEEEEDPPGVLDKGKLATYPNLPIYLATYLHLHIVTPSSHSFPSLSYLRLSITPHQPTHPVVQSWWTSSSRSQAPTSGLASPRSSAPSSCAWGGEGLGSLREASARLLATLTRAHTHSKHHTRAFSMPFSVFAAFIQRFATLPPTM